ncbi:hypothetical protein ACLOJK_028058 [Asimina triloba]
MEREAGIGSPASTPAPAPALGPASSFVSVLSLLAYPLFSPSSSGFSFPSVHPGQPSGIPPSVNPLIPELGKSEARRSLGFSFSAASPVTILDPPTYMHSKGDGFSIGGDGDDFRQ